MSVSKFLEKIRKLFNFLNKKLIQLSTILFLEIKEFDSLPVKINAEDPKKTE